MLREISARSNGSSSSALLREYGASAPYSRTPNATWGNCCLNGGSSSALLREYGALAPYSRTPNATLGKYCLNGVRIIRLWQMLKIASLIKADLLPRARKPPSPREVAFAQQMTEGVYGYTLLYNCLACSATIYAAVHRDSLFAI